MYWLSWGILSCTATIGQKKGSWETSEETSSKWIFQPGLSTVPGAEMHAHRVPGFWLSGASLEGACSLLSHMFLFIQSSFSKITVIFLHVSHKVMMIGIWNIKCGIPESSVRDKGKGQLFCFKVRCGLAVVAGGLCASWKGVGGLTRLAPLGKAFFTGESVWMKNIPVETHAFELLVRVNDAI